MMMTYKKKFYRAIKQTLFIAFLFSVLFIGISLLNTQGHKESTRQIAEPVISEEVRDYRPLVEKYAADYGVTEHVDTILGMMMQESGGRGKDPMQASESYCGERECIKDPELSIKQGVSYFSQTLEEANGDIKLAVQSYNFGKGFIQYIHDKEKDYSQEAAITFSQEMYANDPDKEKYRCLRDEAKEIDACYGDIYYVKSVITYRNKLAEE
ncbi:lysozyme family protein [Virgibacillus salexigens]|uniref:CwlT-like lysozyme domain-containing protein n=3 Tax=Bacillaceae TaxID=186817 RepID=A0A024Q7J9_9BACI|nr:hypothetical protein BN990_00472 [Virgibacillus massiliensis]